MHIPNNKTIDLAFCILLLLFSLMVHQGRIGASINGTDLTTDPANYACMAAAMAHPEAFAKDSAYNDASRYGVHATATTTLISKIADKANYGLAYLKLHGLQFFFHHLAFYLLGIVLLGARWQALLFTVLMGQVYWIPWGTYWGNGFADYTPRSTFAVFYAFFIIAALRIVHQPRWWPLFMAGMGLMVYIHSISTLPTALGFWLGFALFRPESTTRRRHCIWLVFSGLCFVAVMVPFVLKFLRPGVALSPEDVDLLREVLRIRYNIEFTEYWKGFGQFILHYCLLPLFPLGIAGGLVLRRYGTQQEKERAALFAMWALGVLCCAGLFFADQEFARAAGRHPYEFDLIRILRFWVFFAMCLSFMGVNVLLRVIPPQKVWGRRLAGFAWFGLFVGLFLGGQQNQVREAAAWFWNRLDPARYEQAYAHTLARDAMLQALQKHTEPGALIYYPGEDQALRYRALRSLVYSWKDSSIYYYAKDMPGIRFWYDTQKKLKASPTAYMDLAMQSKAEYLLSERMEDKEALEKLGTIVWESKHYILVKLQR